MSDFKAKSTFDKVFEGGLLIKGLSGILELLGGLLFFVFSPEQIHRFADFLTHWELFENPHSKISNILHAVQSFNNSSRVFLIFYLWIHAFIKLVAVIGILKNQLWAYPFSLFTLSGLVVYQLYTILFEKPSLGMIGLSIFDVFIIWMINVEYKKNKSKLKETL